MSTYKYNRLKYFKIIINEAFSAANDENFQTQLFLNAMLAILDKIIYKRPYKKL